MAGRLENKVAIITGAGSGLGRASAIRFAVEGAAVVCADRDAEGAAGTVAAVERAGGRAVAVEMDVTVEEDHARMTAVALETYGRIDAIYANAGIGEAGTVGGTSKEAWDRMIAINLTGVWLANRAVIPTMERQGGGSIINQASIGGIAGVKGIAAYAAAKAGVIGLTKQGAVEYGPSNIRFNAVAPGTVPTPLVTNVYEQRGGMSGGVGNSVEEGLQAAAQRYPMLRLGEPEDIANMALFLASDEAKWITGQVFAVDGGYTAA
jgi:NAD(P)-dependent dehydrogenase (short-subunit alcohol dehydrogenase family)